MCRALTGLALVGGAAWLWTLRADDGQVAIRGRVVFDSNRSGSFGIYTMADDGSDTRVVVDSVAQEMYPDVSPDGQWVAYARTTGTKHFANSELRMCRRDGSDDRLLAEHGTFPRFHDASGQVYFMRDRYEIMILDPVGVTPARRLYPQASAVGDRQILLPSLSPDGQQLAFTTDQPGQWHVAVVDLRTGEEFLVGRGCEPFWTLRGEALLWISSRQTRERTGILSMILEGRRVLPVQDDDAPWGHEYFPWTDADSQRLLWSACPPGQHAHEWSNYQVFMRTGLDGVPVRLSHDEFTNRWPKWFVEGP